MTVVAVIVSASLNVPAQAQEKSASKANFTLRANSVKILLFRPDIAVGAQSTGGMFEPNADWTEQARRNIGTALADVQRRLGNEIVVLEEPVGAGAKTLSDYQALFDVVASSVLEFQMFPGNRLPSKRNSNDLDYTLGPGVAALAASSGADYGLFILTEDQYGSVGRKVFQLLALGLVGAGVQSGVHRGYAGLVDLKTGDLVWINADGAMGGDVRDADGAAKRVTQLLEDFPGAPKPAPVAAAK